MDYLKTKIRNFILKDILKFVVLQDVITISASGRVIIDGEQITDQEVATLKQEVRMLKKMWIYRILLSSPRKHAEDVILKKSTNFQDVANGKTILFTTDMQSNIVDTIEKVVIKK